MKNVFRNRNRLSSVEGSLCTCAEPDNIYQDIARMESLLIGEFVKQSANPPHTDVDQYISTFRVKENLFGYFEEGEEIEVHHIKETSACGVDFSQGDTLLSLYVELTDSGDMRLTTDRCSQPYFSAEEYREVLRGEGCRRPNQSQSIGLDPVGLKLVVLDENGQITADEDPERLVMRVNSADGKVTEYWIG